MKKVNKKPNDTDIVRKVEKLLSQQTNVILSAVDERLRKNRDDIKSDTKSEINKFEIMKAKVSKIEKILLTKLGVSIS